MLWFQRYELLESRTRGNSVKLKTTFNLSRELLAPPEPPSQRRVHFSPPLAFHLTLAKECNRGLISPSCPSFPKTATSRNGPSLGDIEPFCTSY